MPAPNTISVEKLLRLIGTPKCPVLVDVRTDDDFDADPRLIPSAVRRNAILASEWADAFTGRSIVTICEEGHKLSQAAAAWVRQEGGAAEVLEGGVAAWRKAGLPMVPTAMLPARDGKGRTVWVTRARPKIDRIACSWLIRRFVDLEAVFLFVAPSEVKAVAERFNAAAFDIEDVFWSHRGENCTFDTMIEEFGLNLPPSVIWRRSCVVLTPRVWISRRRPPVYLRSRSDYRACTPTILNSSRQECCCTMLFIAGAETQPTKPISMTNRPKNHRSR